MLLGASDKVPPIASQGDEDHEDGDDDDDDEVVDMGSASLEDGLSAGGNDPNSPSERCRRCLAELESVLAHEAMSLLHHTTSVQELPVADATGHSSIGSDKQGNWGRQLFEMQRAQIQKNLQNPATAIN